MTDPLTVVVLSPMAGGYYYGGVLAGITTVVAAAGGRVVLVQTMEAGLSNEKFPAVPSFDAATSLERASGFISLAAAAPADYLAGLVATGKPLILAGNLVDGVTAPAVMPDNIGGVRAAIDHLIAHGHTRIGFLGNFEQFDMIERHEAYVSALADAGLQHGPDTLFVAVDNTEEGGRLQAPAVAAAIAARMTAVVTATDRNALGLLDALPGLGIQPGRDVAVIGFDDVEQARRSTPPLSTVAQHFYRVGELAAQLLLARLRGEDVPPTRHTTGSAFIARESCGCVSAASTEPSLADQVNAPADVLHARVARVIDAGREVGASDEDANTAVVADVVALLDRAGAADRGDVFADAATRLFAGAHRSDSAAAIAEVLLDYGRTILARMPAHDGRHAATEDAVLAMADAFLAAQAESHAKRTLETQATVREQYEIGVRILRHEAGDPRNLAWLASSAVSGAALALWDPTAGVSGALRIAGVYDPAGRLAAILGQRCTAALFPPPAVLALSPAENGEVTFVLPVKARGQDWGLLAIAGGIDATFMIGRETLNHWAALLSVAFEQQALLANVRRSEERYALAAQAANDGLWDWDVVADTVYYAPRWAATLGYDASEIAPTPYAWFDRVHPDDIATLRAAVGLSLAGDPNPIEIEHRVLTASGEYRWMLCRATAVTDASGRAIRMVGSLTDVNERKSLEEQLRYGALHDALTGLPNRALLLDRLSWAIERSRRRTDMNFAVLFLDLDGFKVVNDSLGHHIGDRLLVEVGSRLRASLRAVDTAARVGGDEFVLLLLDIEPSEVPQLVKKVQSRLAEPFDLDGQQVVATASIGIATSRTEYDNADDVLRDADIAMYRAKAGERGSYEIFDAAMHARAVKRLQTEVELRRAFDLGEFEVHYQPIVDLQTCRAQAFEALIRWRHPERGLVSPDDFLPVAEETGLIVRLGHWIIDETCRQIAEWRTAYDGELCVSVNVSNREFWHGGLLEHVVAAIAEHRIPTSALKLEITEGVIMHNPELARVLMEELHAEGLQLHIDDFGTGYSSLHALHRFPIQGLKIDRSFVGGIGVDTKTMELVHTIVAMGRNLGVDVVAEGVETPQQQEWLRDVGCRFAQGYWFARPMPGAAAAAVLGRVLPITAMPADLSRAV